MCVKALARIRWLRAHDASFRLSPSVCRYIHRYAIYTKNHLYTESKPLSGYFSNCHGPPSIYSSCLVFVFIYDARLFWRTHETGANFCWFCSDFRFLTFGDQVGKFVCCRWDWPVLALSKAVKLQKIQCQAPPKRRRRHCQSGKLPTPSK